MKERLIKGTGIIFACGMAILLLICLAAAFIYAAALAVGQPFSISIHNAMKGYVFPVVYRAGILLSFDGIINIYLRGERVFCLDIPKRKR